MEAERSSDADGFPSHGVRGEEVFGGVIGDVGTALWGDGAGGHDIGFFGGFWAGVFGGIYDCANVLAEAKRCDFGALRSERAVCDNSHGLLAMVQELGCIFAQGDVWGVFAVAGDQIGGWPDAWIVVQGFARQIEGVAADAGFEIRPAELTKRFHVHGVPQGQES